MSVFEYKNEILLIDMGLQFPEENTPGIDYIIPNVESLLPKRHNIKGIIITHGHYDHIGGIPHLLDKLGASIPIYATDLTREIIKRRQEDYSHAAKPIIHSIKDGQSMQISEHIKVHFYEIEHTIPDSIGLVIETPVGNFAYCTDLKIDSGNLIATRPIFAGKAFVDVRFETPIQMATARPNSFIPKETGGTATVVAKNIEPGELRAVMKEIVKGKSDKVDLTEAPIIVSGGRAMQTGDNFKILQELADVLGATVGASRAAVDSGYVPHDMQVGQTGKTVNPNLYIACGISGAIQHLAGMRTSKVIVAINKDAEAPIFTKADYGIVGDLFQIIPLLTQEFKRVLAE